MAILKNGLAGGITGKLGNTVAYQVQNKTIIRVIGKRKKPPSEKQLASMQAITIVNVLLKPALLFVNAGFKPATANLNMYPYNKAVSYNRLHALKGHYPQLEIAYDKVLWSMGNLPSLQGAAVALHGSTLKFTWDPQEWIGWPRCNDQVMLMAYFPDIKTGSHACFVPGGARRIAAAEQMELPPALSDQRMEIYIAVITDDRKDVSCSEYLGRLN